MIDIKVISLVSSFERRKYMESQLSGIPYSFFDALSPNDLEESLFENRPDFLSKEAVATFESHRKIISQCGDLPLLVLEDDSTPTCSDFLEKIKNLLRVDYEWDVMFIGYKPNYTAGYPKKIVDGFVKFNRFIGMHSYIVNPKSKDKILDLLGPPITHVDYRFSELIKPNKIIAIFSTDKLFKQNKDFNTQIPKRKHIENGEI